MIYDNDFNFTNQLLDVTDESFSQELKTIKKEREALIQASHDLLGSDGACHYNSNPSPKLNSFVDVVSDVQKNDEDDLVIEQLTAQLHELQQLLIQQQKEQAAQAADTTKKIINGLSVLLNRFINNFPDLHARMQAVVKKLSTKYYNLKNTLDFVSIDEIESVNQELNEFKTSHHHEFVDQLQGLGEELVLALDYLKPDAVDALQALVKRTDVYVTGLVPHNLALKLFVKQAILKIKRLFAQVDDLVGQTKNL